MTTPKRKRNLLDFEQKREIIDYAMGQRHNLDIINILTDDDKINDSVKSDYVGMDRFVARKKMIQDLAAQGLLNKIEPHKLMVPHGDRTNAVIEPYLTDQWSHFIVVKIVCRGDFDATCAKIHINIIIRNNRNFSIG
jgi:valyl-tRNA synthetase